MSQIIDAKYSTLVGTVEQIRELLLTLGQNGIVDLKFSNLVALDESLTHEQLRLILATSAQPSTAAKA